MCQKCRDKWEIYKEKEAEYQKAKQDYLQQTKPGFCEDKEGPTKERFEELTEKEKILQEAGFLESSKEGGEGLWFKQLEEPSEAVVFIDLTKGESKTYGFRDGQSLDREIVDQHCKKPHRLIKALDTAQDEGQSKLEV